MKENLIFSQLNADDLRLLIQSSMREELAAYFLNQSSEVEADVNGDNGIELAKRITGLSKATIYAKTSRNEIPHYKKGKKLYFVKEELLNWIRQGRRKTQSELRTEAENYIKNNGH